MHDTSSSALRRLALLVLCCSGPAYAQSEPSSPSGSARPALDEIVVTARKTTENLQTTPVAVTAIGEQEIITAQVVNVTDLQRLAPATSVSTGTPGGSGYVFVSIRGAGNLQPTPANDPAVGIYVDGVYIARPSQGVTDLIDIEQIEVLRGPQGTLFGRNTTGGALSITTKSPTDEFGGVVRTQIGNHGRRGASLVLNLPLVEEVLSSRFVYNFSEHDGYGKNLTLDREVGDNRSHFFRGQLRWAPDDSDWTVNLSGDYNRISDHGQMSSLTGFDDTSTSIIGAFGLDQEIRRYLKENNSFYDTYGTGIPGGSDGAHPSFPPPGDELKAYGFSGVIEGRLGDLDVKLISAYRYSKLQANSDIDATPIDLLANETEYLSKAFSQELQISGDITERLNFIAGGYYFNEKGREISVARALGIIPEQNTFRNFGDVKNVSMGAYTQLYYDLTDRLRLTGGLRWTWDERNVSMRNVLNILLPIDAPGNCAGISDVQGQCKLARERRFDYPAYTVGIDFEANEHVFLYAKTSRASKAGGWNLLQGAIPSFQPETVRDVELGMKTNLLENRLRFNVASFYSWQDDITRTLSSFVDGASTQGLFNAGEARVYGMEFELQAIPWEGMIISGNLTLLRGEYVDGTFVDQQTISGIPGCNGGQAIGTYVCPVDRSSERLSQLPRTQFAIAATQTVPLELGELSFHLDYAYIGKQAYNQFTAADAQPQEIKDLYGRASRLNQVPSYGLLNGRVALNLENPRIELALFGRNLANKKYLTQPFADLIVTPLGFATAYLGEPRVYGIEATYRFGGE